MHGQQNIKKKGSFIFVCVPGDPIYYHMFSGPVYILCIYTS